ncbi:hypothetical protein PAXRUDRAFT_21471 [Paxillus rubicundulus Ve08.2h10]|uniref:Uncharacterized protein n=1 Tax=Paxillus rubicundulus Ve08.2h10 TaxID=930991 RepID=A0A0D0CPZ1_9AGAM|nr:hypothetical protein PAXRUDRAFT_21471 [Paxillus rubicundulus Ve08.2h10]
MPPLPPGKAGLQFIPAGQATLGAVEGSNPSPGTSEGSIPRPFQRPHSCIRSGDIKAAGYPLQAGPKFGTWPLLIKEGQGLHLQIEAEDAFGRPKGKIHIKVYHPVAGPPPRSIPRASALELIATPVNPLLDIQPRPTSNPTDQIIKGLKVRVASLEKQVERIPDLELQLSSMAWVVEALQEQVQGQLATHSFPTSSHRSLPLPPSVSRQMQRLHLEMANSHPKSAFLALEAEGQPSSHLDLRLVGTSADGGKSAPSPLHLHMHQQPHPGVEMEDDALGVGSDDDARPPLPIPPPFTDLVPPIESLSSESDMELEDVDME